MCKKYQILFILIFQSLIFLSNIEASESGIDILKEPELETITIGEGPKEIIIIARTEKQDSDFKWEKTGPGELKGNPNHPGVIYVPPSKIQGDKQETVIRVLVIDQKGNKTHKELKFILLAPEPPPPFRIQQVYLTNSQHLGITPKYTVNRSETVIIGVNTTKCPDSQVEIKCVAISGKITSKGQEINYTAPGEANEQDIVTCTARDKETGQEIKHSIAIRTR